ncbi:DUF3857 domain-containing protein [uncultured Flavobacterium sp.]|uniref:DUF3857 domain-containing protein n=1 Tax=uncultured Flavobacterium sp. TaxID=165435 RepID=UPI0030EF6F14|tara:strand:+ start:9895 stop:11793 length:1899 start_codon:yes stop_codon:yes gene_type:complete
MKKGQIFIIFILFVFNKSFSQKESYLAVYPDSLKENANAIIKENIIDISIPSYDRMIIKKRRVITILNEYGLKHLDTNEYYDNSSTIKNMEAEVYNAFGQEIRKIRRKDFKENSISEGSVITDNRVVYLDYTPTQYPFTLVYESEISTSNTAFIPTWFPIEDYFLSIQNATLKIEYANDVKLKYKEINFDKNIVRSVEGNKIKYSISNVKAIRKEQLSPSFQKFLPYVLIGLEEFKLEGVKGNSSDWNSFGKWMYTNLLKDTEEIPVESISKIQKIIGTETDPIKKAKIIYNYVQNRTRYVSIQLGIGGWKPMLAKDVDRLGYGDCKALTNYTRSLLKAFDVPSYYAIVYSGDEKRNLEEDFVSMQGNHVILGIPNKNEIIWLECTSQIHPFGFQGDFTDDRKVLIVSNEKSEIVKTKKFNQNSNTQNSNTEIKILTNNDVKCSTEIISKGILYDAKFNLESKSKEDLLKVYKDYFSSFNNKVFSNITIVNNKESIELKESISFEAKDFIKKSGNIIILPINLMNQVSFIPQKYRNRNTPFEIERGYSYEDIITIKFPENYSLEELPSNINVNSEFGLYNSEFLSNSKNEISYKRSIVINEGYYSKDKYESYRLFREQIAKNESIKVVLKTN